jgi:hypothetical protein
MISAKEKFEICTTILRILDGSVTETEFKQFEGALAEKDDVRHFYLLMLETYAHLQKPGHSFTLTAGVDDMAEGFNSELWQLLAKEEMESPSVHVSPPKAVPDTISLSDGKAVNVGRRDTRSAWVSITLSAAALLFLIVFVRFAPVRDTSYGRIADYRQAVLKDMKPPLSKGMILRNESLILEAGILEIAMDDGTAVLLEAPAEMRLEDDNQVFLVQGQLTAKVPPSAIGFTVRTPSASVVDYGTEFGILVDQYANTEAHVLKGEVEMRLGSNIRVFDKALRLSADQAGRASGQNLTGIPAATHRFTYDIPSSFEYYAKSLEPILYFGARGAAGGSFRDVTQQSGLSIEVNAAVTVSSGPDAGDPAVYFTGDDRGVLVTHVREVRQHPQGAYTICCWIRFDRLAEQIVYANSVIGKTEDSQYYRILSMNANGELEHSAYRSDQGKWRTVKSPSPLRSNAWYFVAISNALGTTKNMYLNGKFVADDSAIQATPLETYQTLEFGGKRDAFAGFEGSLGDIVLFGRALSEKEIEGLYKSAVNDR